MPRLGHRALFATIIAVAMALSPTTAQAATATITTAVADVVNTSEVCFQHPYSVTITLSPDTTQATLRVEVTGPTGERKGSQTRSVTPSAGATQSFTYLVAFCDFDPRGLYTITTSADLYDGTSNTTTITGTPATFTFPERPVVDVDGTATKMATYDGRTLKFRLTAYATPAGAVEGAPLKWRYKLDAHAPVKVWQGAGDRYTYSREFGFHSGLHKVVIWKNGILVRTVKIHVK